MKGKGLREPPRLLYSLVRAVAAAYCRLVWGFKACGGENIPDDGPLFLLCSHQGMVDYFFVVAAIKNRRLHFVASQRYFEHGVYRRIFRIFGVIPKVQFHTDPRSIATMLKTVKNGGAVCLFPAGQTSMCGVPGHIPFSIARLVKKSGATVAALRLNGSFFTRSRFGRQNFGQTRADIRVILTPQQLEKQSTQQIYETICSHIDYNDFRWQERTGVLFRGRHRAFGYENILYVCPKCGAKYSMASSGNRFYCKNCSNAATVGMDMHLHPENGDCAVFPTMLQWYRWQQQALFDRIDKDSGFCLSDKAEVLVYEKSKLKSGGTGVLYLDHEGIGFDGTVAGQPAALYIRHVNLPGLSAEAGGYIELFHPELGLLRFIPENKAGITEWKTAQEYLYSKAAQDK